MSSQGLYLASQSPRRAELLRQAGIPFERLSVDIDETPLQAEPASEYVLRLARAKAEVALGNHPDRPHSRWPVLGSDTSVVLGERIMGKPRDREDALEMLMSLSGRSHQVMTGVCLCSEVFSQTALSVTEVRFRALSKAELEAYWQTGEPKGKAGAYAIQGRAAVFVEQLKGSYTGVVGLPLLEVEHIYRAYWRQQAMVNSPD